MATESIIFVMTTIVFAFLYFALRKKAKDQSDEILKKKELLETYSQRIEKRQQTIVQLGKDVDKQKGLLAKYSRIMDMDEAVAASEKEKIQNLNDLKRIKEAYHKLKHEHDLYYENLEMVEVGFYTPKYDLTKSEEYKVKLNKIRSRQKEMIKNKKAIICHNEWTLNGSRAEGKKVTNQLIRLGLNAFNVQCDNAILKVNASNVLTYEERIDRIRERIDKHLEGYNCEITNHFYEAKREELWLAHEYQEKVEQEKEEQREAREQMREEEKARKEYEKVKTESEKEEKMYEKALKKAQDAVSKASDVEKAKLMKQLEEVQAKLDAAHEKKERALSMAQQTKRGHVYVISNLGSFGDKVYKIGMTRRLDPMDRVKELGDASVPFRFDVHAIIYSEDAPQLESSLHKHFSEKRINRVNNRKEFFSAELAEIKGVAEELGANCEFTMIADADEYRQTLAMSMKEQDVVAEGKAEKEVHALIDELEKKAA